MWMPVDITDGKSTLFQVMAWCRQATSRYLSQYWPRSLSPFGVTRPQWVKQTKELVSCRFVNQILLFCCSVILTYCMRHVHACSIHSLWCLLYSFNWDLRWLKQTFETNWTDLTLGIVMVISHWIPKNRHRENWYCPWFNHIPVVLDHAHTICIYMGVCIWQLLYVGVRIHM